MINEFFVEIWGLKALALGEPMALRLHESECAAILATDDDNFERFMALEEFREILHLGGFRADIFGLQSAQKSVLTALSQAKISKQLLLSNLAILATEQIIEATKFNRLKDVLAKISASAEQSVLNAREIFSQKSLKLDQIYDRLLAVCDDEILQHRLKSAKSKLQNLNFNVAITGVINAGKSSLLNALLNKELLGSSNIPETANLTMLKFASTPSAKVSFWDETQAREIGVYEPSSEQFLGRTINIEQSVLSDYTSAKSPLSKLVKSVEIYENFDLLQGGVSIIDTPGIDDAVFLREQIVREYMSECDLMVHLMNVSQSMTQKDVEFITQTLKNSHIARLCVVLTHSDLLSQTQLQEVINYTQKSLRCLGISADLFCLSSRVHFLGQDGGISEFKNYLFEQFFGENSQKTALAMRAFKLEILNVANEILSRSKQNLLAITSSSISTDELANGILVKENELKEQNKTLTDLVKNELAKIDENELNASFELSLKSLANTLKDRLLNELNFSKTSLHKFDAKRASYVICTILNDGIIHAIRTKRQELVNALNSCLRRLAAAGLDVGAKDNIFNVLTYLKDSGVRLEFTKISEQICAHLTSANFERDMMSLTHEFLAQDSLKNVVLDLVKFEKSSFSSHISQLLKERENLLENELARLREISLEFGKNSENLAQQKQKYEILQRESELVILELGSV